MSKKVIGCILMILGTSVGAGMLALPVVTAQESFQMSLVLLFSSWLLMTIGAYSLLEVNCWLPSTTNMISMADKTLGVWGKAITWIIYLFLLYCLICAYLSGLGDILQELLANIHVEVPLWFSTVLGLLLLGTVIYRGIASVDMVNRTLMSIKLIAYILLVGLIAKKINLSLIFEGDFQWRSSAFMVMLASFGYAIIVPSIRHYLNSDVKLIKRVVLIGSLLPLVIYAAWIFVIQGLIPKSTDGGLISMIVSPHTNSMLINQVSTAIHHGWISNVVTLFISICAVTSFLGVSICLTDFISDGLSIEKKGKPALLVYGIAYGPPLAMVLISPGLFIRALDYAGMLCLILLIILPLMMLYVGRYQLKIQGNRLLPFGKKVVLGVLFIAFVLLLINLWNIMH